MGKIKFKGTYDYNLQWHQDPSALIVPKAAEATLVRGENIEQFIRAHRDPFDFIIRGKVPRSNQLMIRWPECPGVELQLPNTCRYFVSVHGGTLVKIAPPTGTPGSYKRRAGITDETYTTVLAEVGTDWDERIHTKNKSQHTTREMSVNSGWRVTECNDIKDFDWSLVNYDYYIEKTHNIVDPLVNVV